MFACHYDKKSDISLPIKLNLPFSHERVGTDFASFFSREGEGKFSLTLVLADMECLAGTANI